MKKPARLLIPWYNSKFSWIWANNPTPRVFYDFLKSWKQLLSLSHFALERYICNLVHSWNDATRIFLRESSTKKYSGHTAQYPLTPPPNQIYSQNWYAFSMLKLTKVSTSNRGGFRVLLHKPCHEEGYVAHLSCTAPERWRKRFESGRK